MLCNREFRFGLRLGPGSAELLRGLYWDLEVASLCGIPWMVTLIAEAGLAADLAREVFQKPAAAAIHTPLNTVVWQHNDSDDTYKTLLSPLATAKGSWQMAQWLAHHLPYRGQILLDLRFFSHEVERVDVIRCDEGCSSDSVHRGPKITDADVQQPLGNILDTGIPCAAMVG